MIVRTLSEIKGTDRDVQAKTWNSQRLLLARDGQSFSMHETVLYAGTETSMWYANHVEAVYCVGGEGELVNDETGDVHPLRDGTLYLLDGHEHHRVRAHSDLRMVCVFTPPVTGREVHDEHGAYPLIVEEREATA
ncbi:L-ectoine synthase [Mycobacterium kyorinense]|uniref:L-ectoine synthase n=1 Tax=Mycobacterium kyorinense TaxID=487514 RepID=A0A1A2ZE01_9MYCO|nr:ectoine synthase [Mycobacterium kyorinense]OBI47316.1 L-ectoine synthase [Mycobacterium kyorinense]